MKKLNIKRLLILSFVILILILISFGLYNVIYNRYFIPVLKLEKNYKVVTINGIDYALHRLSYNGTTYISEPLVNTDKYQLENQVGRTMDNLQIYQVKSDNKHLIMTGFMFPQVVFEKEENK